MVRKFQVIIAFAFFCLLLKFPKVNSREIKDKESLKGTILRISAFDLAPFSWSVKQGTNVTYRGASVALAELMSYYFGTQVQYIRMPSEEISKFGGGVTAGRELARNAIDLANFPIPLNIHHSKVLDLSFPIWIESFAMLQPYPEEQSRLVAPIRPYTNTVWLLFLLSSFMFVGVLTLVMMCSRGRDDRLDQEETLPFFLNSIYRGTEYVLTIITSQGNYVPYASPLSMKILTGTWILAMIVMINSYAGLLTAYLSVPKLVPTVETFEDLVNRPGWSVTIDRNNDLATKFLNASSGPFKVLGDQLRNNPDLFITDHFKTLINVVQHNCIYPTVMSFVKFYVASDLKNAGFCRTTSSTTPLLYMTAFCFGYQKNSDLTELANQRFVPRMWQMGYIGYLKRTYFTVTDRCRVDTVPKGKTSSMKLIDFVGAFVLLGIGFGISTVVFFLERILAVPSVKGKKGQKVRFG